MCYSNLYMYSTRKQHSLTCTCSLNRRDVSSSATFLTSLLALWCEKWFIVSFSTNASTDWQLVCFVEPPIPTGQRRSNSC